MTDDDLAKQIQAYLADHPERTQVVSIGSCEEANVLLAEGFISQRTRDAIFDFFAKTPTQPVIFVGEKPAAPIHNKSVSALPPGERLSYAIINDLPEMMLHTKSIESQTFASYLPQISEQCQRLLARVEPTPKMTDKKRFRAYRHTRNKGRK